MRNKRKVLVTGASGLIAGQVLPALWDRYKLTLLDVRTKDRNGNPVEGVQMADLVNRERDRYRHHFQGVDTVVHFGFIRHNRLQANSHFWAELDNVQMAYNVYQTCLNAPRRFMVLKCECRQKINPGGDS
jgi:nucleoside-diphosphate-sugar epimerase